MQLEVSGEALINGWIQLVTGYVKVICWILRVVGGGANDIGLCFWAHMHVPRLG